MLRGLLTLLKIIVHINTSKQKQVELKVYIVNTVFLKKLFMFQVCFTLKHHRAHIENYVNIFKMGYSI